MNYKALMALAMIVLMASCAFAGDSPRWSVRKTESGVEPLVGSGKILPPFGDKGVDTNASGKFEFLQISVNVSITLKGNFRVSAYFDPTGGGFGVQNQTYSFLDKGNHTIDVNLDGFFFGTSELDGPYNVTCTLTAVSLNKDETLDSITNKTKAYKATDFESLDKGVGLSGKMEDAQTHTGVLGLVAVMMPNIFVGFTTTDIAGNFSIKLPAGLGLLYARDGQSNYLGYMRLRQFVDGDLTGFVISLYGNPATNANVSGMVKNVSGTPLSGAKVTFVNYTTGFSKNAYTDQQGNYSIKLPEGGHRIFTSLDNYYSNATALELESGQNWFNATLKDSLDSRVSRMKFATWGQVGQSLNSTTYSSAMDFRLQADLLGNMDFDANISEVSNFVDFMTSSSALPIPEINTYDSFYLDGIFFDPVKGTSSLTIRTQGSVMDGHLPLYMNFTREYVSNQSIQLKKDHGLRVNMSYDSDLDIYLPFAYEMSGSNHSVNATVTGKAIVSVIVVPDPDTNDSIDSEWVDITASATLPGYLSGTITDKKGGLIEGAYVNTTSANTTSNAQGKYNLTLDLGTYTIDVSRPTYGKETATNIVVQPGKTTQLDFVLKTVPDAPKGLQASAGDATVNLSWSVPSYDGGSTVKSYNLYRGDSATDLKLLTSNTGTSHSDKGLTNGKTYYYAVSALNSVGEGQKTTTVSVKPVKKEVKPAAPTNLNTVAGDGYVDLSWTASTTLNVSYDIYRSTTPGSWNTLLAGNVTGTSYKDTSAVNGVTYYYIVRAVGASGLESDPSNEMSAMPKGKETVQPSTDYMLIAGAMMVLIVLLIIIILALKARKRPSGTAEEPPTLTMEKETKKEKDEPIDKKEEYKDGKAK